MRKLATLAITSCQAAYYPDSDSYVTLQNEADAFRKVRLRVEDVQGKNCLTNFWVCSSYRPQCCA